MTAQKNKSKKSDKKKKNAFQLEMARRYESVWHYMYNELPEFKQKGIVAEPFGRFADDLAHEVAKRAEADAKLPNDDNQPF